jgi:hypothetical protein
MLIIRVELHSAITGKVTEIARAMVHNIGGTSSLGNYQARFYTGRSKEELDQRRVTHCGIVVRHPRLRQHVWKLVLKALVAAGYADGLRLDL